MQPHQQRVVDEKADLDGKLKRLSTFMDGKLFENLPTSEQELLREQRVYMRNYSAVLGERIAAFPA